MGAGMKHISIKLLAIVVFLSAVSIQSNAQSKGMQGSVSPVRVGSAILNMGIGVGAEYRGDYYGTPFGTKIAAEWGLWHAGPGVITLGGEAGASFSNGGYYDNYRARTIVIAVRSAWHYGWKVRGLDTYGGFSAGMGFHHYDYNHNTDVSYNSVIPVAGAFVGASYFVSPKFGFNAEAGYDITQLQIGLVFKLK